METLDLTTGCYSETATAAGYAENKMGKRESWASERPPQQAGVHSISRALTLRPDLARSLNVGTLTMCTIHTCVCVCVCVCVNGIKHMYKMNVQLDEL